MRRLHIRGQTEKHVTDRAARGRLDPHLAIAEQADRRHTFVERRAPPSAGVDADALARLIAHLDLAKRQAIAIEQFRHFPCGGERLLFRAAMFDGFGAQCLDALQDARELCVAGAIVGPRAPRGHEAAAQFLEQRTRFPRRAVFRHGAFDCRGDKLK